MPIVVVVSFLLASCGGGSKGQDLDPFLCRDGDVGDGYQELARGDFSARDLADLGPDADSRELEFREAGMMRGRFAFFKQSLPKPPFAPPIDVLCQVIEFESEAAASKFVEDLKADATLGATLMGWTPPGSSRVEEENPSFFGAGDGRIRAFLMTWELSDSPTHVAVTVAAEGRQVRTFAAGFEDRLIDGPWEGWDAGWARWVEAGAP